MFCKSLFCLFLLGLCLLSKGDETRWRKDGNVVLRKMLCVPCNDEISATIDGGIELDGILIIENLGIYRLVQQRHREFNRRKDIPQLSQFCSHRPLAYKLSKHV